MQLEKHDSVRRALAAATCAVLGGGAQAAQQSDSEWTMDSSVLYYSEQGRVDIVEPAIFATQTISADETMTFKGVYDSMTGASPNGASPTNTSQTFTGASGGAGYTVEAGETPMRDFSDSRIAAGLDWSKKTSSLVTRDLGLNFSTEEDYTSFGGTVNFAHDLNNKLTTVAFGGGLTYDLVKPSGGPPTGLASTSVATAKPQTVTGASAGGEDEGEGFEGEPKTMTDVLVGVTQVLSRRSLVQVNYSHSYMSGYLTDPYKILSVVDPSTGETLDYVYEKRPDTRNSDVLYTKFVHHLESDVAHLSYRYYRDDWGVRSHTGTLRYHMKFGNVFYLEPQFRYYTQTAADFYDHSLVLGESVKYASADLRLGEMTGTTAGLRLGAKFQGGEVGLRVARMRQTGESHPSDAVGVQKQFDLYPTLEVTMINLNYATTF